MNPEDYYHQATLRNLGIFTAAEQDRLRNSRVAIVGLGGGGGIYLTTLTRMGVGHFNIADFDRFDVVNINRQAGAMSSTIGQSKSAVMQALAQDIHPGVEIDCWEQGIGADNADSFVANADVVVDALDVFAMPARQILYAAARRAGKPVLFAAPLGFGATLAVFMPQGMSFEEYFDISPGMTTFDLMVSFVVGLGPSGLHLRYLDLGQVDPAAHSAPSCASAISLMTGLLTMEVACLLLQRRPPCAVPQFVQFDPYLWKLARGRLPWGNRGPLQRLKRWWVARRFRHLRQRFEDAGLETLPLA